MLKVPESRRDERDRFRLLSLAQELIDGAMQGFRVADVRGSRPAGQEGQASIRNAGGQTSGGVH